MWRVACILRIQRLLLENAKPIKCMIIVEIVQQKVDIREKNSNHWRKVNCYMSMIQVVFSIGIEAGGTKCVATSILIVSFSPDVLHRRPVQAVHLLVESLYFYSQPYLQTKHMFFSYFLMHAHDFIQRRDGRE